MPQIHLDPLLPSSFQSVQRKPLDTENSTGNMIVVRLVIVSSLKSNVIHEPKILQHLETLNENSPTLVLCAELRFCIHAHRQGLSLASVSNQNSGVD